MIPSRTTDKMQIAVVLHHLMLRVNVLAITKYASPLLGYVRPPEDLARFDSRDLFAFWEQFDAMATQLTSGMSPEDVKAAHKKVNWPPAQEKPASHPDEPLRGGIEESIVLDCQSGMTLEQIAAKHTVSIDLIRAVLALRNYPGMMAPDVPPTLVQRYQAGSQRAYEEIRAEAEPIITREAEKWAGASGLAFDEIKETIESHLPRWLMQKNEGLNWAGLESYLAYCIAEEVGKNLRKRREDGECST